MGTAQSTLEEKVAAPISALDYQEDEFQPLSLPFPVFSMKDHAKNTNREGFEENTTIFGKILQGKLPAKILYEDNVCMCIKDISPASTHHYLVIPKQYITHVDIMKQNQQKLIERMVAVGEAVAEANGIDDAKTARKAGMIVQPFVNL